jgi:hypothetical protein
MSGERPRDPEYVAARAVLLDALEALGSHRKAWKFALRPISATKSTAKSTVCRYTSANEPSLS